MLAFPNETIHQIFNLLSIDDVKRCKLNKEMKCIVDDYIWCNGKCIINVGNQDISTIRYYISNFKYINMVLEVTTNNELTQLMEICKPILHISKIISILVIISYTPNSFSIVKDCIENINKVYSKMETIISLLLIK